MSENQMEESVSPIVIKSISPTVSYGDPELSELLTRKQPKFLPQAPKCAKCEKSVYKAEEIRAANKYFHKLCFKCTLCNKLLETNILTEHQGDLFCRSCYGKKFGPKGYGYGGGAGVLSTETIVTPLSNSTNSNMINSDTNSNSINSFTSGISKSSAPSLKSTFSTYYSNEQNVNDTNGIKPHTIQRSGSISSNDSSSSILKTPLNGQSQNSSPPSTPSLNGSNLYHLSALNHERKSSVSMSFGGSDKCARCVKAVYAAERCFAAGKAFHKLCFTCANCKKTLSSINCCDNSDGEVFCKNCYGKLYGPKGVGFGIGAGTLQTTI